MPPIYNSEAKRAIRQVGELAHRFAGMRIAITGAGGFLGSQFIHFFLTLNEFLEEKCTVFAYDNFIRGKPDWLDDLKSREDLIFREADVTENQDFDNCDYIIHAASIASPVFYRMHPLETMDVNVNGTRRILEYSRKNPLKGILFLSSSEIYGNPPVEFIPTPETFGGQVSCIGPRACYDESKRYGETLCVNYHREFGTPVKIVRPFNIYGVGLKPDDGRVISDFFSDLIHTGKVKLFSDGKATRTFCYISDAMDGFIRALMLGKHGEAYNIGNDTPEISMTDLAHKIIELAGGNGRIEYAVSKDPEYLTDNPQRRRPLLDKARTQLNYHPQTSLEDGLALTYAYYKSIL
jgi:dTDP-glucose 4,6-dehydratase/UDP-glucuronate decarboxylase